MVRQTPSPSIDYIRKLYARQDPLLESINAALAELGIDKQIGPEEGKILQMLVVLTQVETIIEVGTLAGYSTLWLARGLPEDGRIYTIEQDPKNIAMAGKFFDQSDERDKIVQLEGEAHKQLDIIAEDGPFDMIFIDADKPSYGDYLDWAEKNLRSFGLIVADNTLLGGAVPQDAPPEGVPMVSWKAMRDFNERLADEDKYYTIMLPTQQGLTIAVKMF
jgi:predicted O-methyltransferase YrrM